MNVVPMRPTASAPKPRLRMKWGVWMCFSANHSGAGATPRQAYDHWRFNVNAARRHFPFDYVRRGA